LPYKVVQVIVIWKKTEIIKIILTGLLSNGDPSIFLLQIFLLHKLIIGGAKELVVLW